GRWSADVAFVRKDGSEGVAELVVVPLREADGRMLGSVATYRDVSDRQRAQQALRARVEQLDALATLGQRALAVTDLDALLAEAVDRVAATLDVRSCEVLEQLRDEDVLVLRAGAGWSSERPREAEAGAWEHSPAG